MILIFIIFSYQCAGESGSIRIKTLLEMLDTDRSVCNEDGLATVSSQSTTLTKIIEYLNLYSLSL